MAMRNAVRQILNLPMMGGSQVFLGAPWLPTLLGLAPESWKERIALELLALSPHYFYRTSANRDLGHLEFLQSERARNTGSRQHLIDGVVRPFLRPEFTVLDYGCGPGHLAFAVSASVRSVIACDISSGVLACAGILNRRDNIQYLPVPPNGGLKICDQSVDLVYSFAVIQHVDDTVFQQILCELWRVMRNGARGLCHVVLNGAYGWKTENDWREDRSLKGRAKWAVGLHCFSREPARIIAMAEAVGFSEVHIQPIDVPGLEDDVAHQHLLHFVKHLAG